MKEIVVISGKGGTGKTSLAASFATLGSADLVVADCDVDAADMHLLLNPDFASSEDFYSGELAVIDNDICDGCAACLDVCRFDAIKEGDINYSVDEIECEGCAYCSRICPLEAIEMVEQNVGEWYISRIKSGGYMVHAKLGVGAENSGKLVAKVKKEAARIAKEGNFDYVLVDSSPGIGCPVISSLSGASFVVLVTEPTVSGLHDLRRIYDLVQKIGIPAGCIINKSDLNNDTTEKIIQYLNAKGIAHIASLPYDENFTRAMTYGETIVEYDKNGSIKNKIKDSWDKILKITNERK